MSEKEIEKQVKDGEPDVVVELRLADLQGAVKPQAKEAKTEGMEKRGTEGVEKRGREEAQAQAAQVAEPEKRAEPTPVPEAGPIPVIPAGEPAQTEHQPEVRTEPARVESPQAGLVGVRTIRQGLEDGDEFLAELMVRAIPIAMRGWATPQQAQELENVLKRRGLDMRAIGIDSTGFVVYEEIARQFTTKALPGTIGRNHWPVVPMRNTKKITVPAVDTTGINVQWGRGGGTPSTSDPAFSSFTIEVDSLEAFVEVRDDAVLFNPAGVRFVQTYVIPGIREALQFNEDKAFFISSGTSPWSTAFKGLKHATGVTEVAPGSNGDPLTLDVLDGMIKALPPAYADPAQLAFYLAWERALDLQEILGQRQTGLGDYFLAGIARDNLIIPPGPRPMAFYRGIPVYGVPHLPTDETVGTSNDCSTGLLVYRKALAIGDGAALRIEPIRERGFLSVLQFQEWVGLGYAAYASAAIVRRPGIRPRA